ncbi:MAG: flavin reductase [Hyphomicrobiales bacterium]|nr:MAG: flavin reductase [Hyphomicrobiales bacterium]
MFYRTDKNEHGLPHNPFKALVSPRPIGWISTRSVDGINNLAPYSFFNAISDSPPMVMFSSDTYKDSIRNAEQTGSFACNLVSYGLKDAMNLSSQPVASEIDEFELAGLTIAECETINVPYVKLAPAILECRTLKVERLVDLAGGQAKNWMCIGQVTAIHIDDTFLEDGLVNTARLRPLSRLGYREYAVIDKAFALDRPQEKSRD